jgi:DNA topoisomerase-1
MTRRFAAAAPRVPSAPVPRTRRVDCSGPGIRRQRRGRGFSFHEEDGERITDEETLERIRALAIPPAWKDVWVCTDPRGHIQATGIDDAGRKQYRYHDDWRAHRDRAKFDEMEDFARRLPKLRKRIHEALGEPGLTVDRICACAVALLDLGLFRIGSERYENENESYGLTTLKCEHLTIEDGAAVFDYPSKSGQRSCHRITDPDVVKVLRALQRGCKRGRDLFGYREGREWRDLDAAQVNAWIKETAGDEFSAKDFRTWNATVLCAVHLAVHVDEEGVPKSKSARKRIANLAVRETAEYLNNTPAVCRSSYIDPRVFDRFDSGTTMRASLERIERTAGPGEFPEREAIERAVLKLL